MSNKVLEGMVTAYHRKLEPRSDMSGWHHDDAMRAALLWLASNVSDEMGCALLQHLPDTAFRADTKTAIAAALRAAAGENK